MRGESEVQARSLSLKLLEVRSSRLSQKAKRPDVNITIIQQQVDTPWTDWNMISNQANNVAADATAWLATDDVIADSDLTVKWTQIQTEAVNKLAAYSTAGLLPHEVTFRLTPHDSDEGVITAAANAAAAALDSDEG